MIMKFLCTVLLLTVFLLGCAPIDPAPLAQQANAPISEPPVSQTADASQTAAVPSPTATPLATPTPFDARKETLGFENNSYTLVQTVGHGVTLFAAPDRSGGYSRPLHEEAQGVQVDWLVSETIRTNNDTFLHVSAIGSTIEGYLRKGDTQEADVVLYSRPTYALLARPYCLIYAHASVNKTAIVAREGFHLARVVAERDGFCIVLTEDGASGYVQSTQLQFLTTAEAESFLLQTLPDTESTPKSFRLPEFADDAEACVGTKAKNSETFLYTQLAASGLQFSVGYYALYQKPLFDRLLYVNGLYLDDVYNSLLFKLWNSAGDQVTANGQETEWAYIADYDALQRGDLVFFSAYGANDVACIEGAEVICRGQHSGYVTDCGLYLGNDRLLWVENGVVTIVEHLRQSSLYDAFDCARRISPTVTDACAHLREVMLSLVYDRLGTPYDRINRVNDVSFDCSGIICWTLRCLDLTGSATNPLPTETVASGLCSTTFFQNDTRMVTLTPLSESIRNQDEIARLQRGDLVFLTDEKKQRVGHVMLYLGDGCVIHSTQIDDTYRGTLVARFRPALQELYFRTLRITAVTERDGA